MALVKEEENHSVLRIFLIVPHRHWDDHDQVAKVNFNTYPLNNNNKWMVSCKYVPKGISEKNYTLCSGDTDDDD